MGLFTSFKAKPVEKEEISNELIEVKKVFEDYAKVSLISIAKDNLSAYAIKMGNKYCKRFFELKDEDEHLEKCYESDTLFLDASDDMLPVTYLFLTNKSITIINNKYGDKKMPISELTLSRATRKHCIVYSENKFQNLIIGCVRITHNDSIFDFGTCIYIEAPEKKEENIKRFDKFYSDFSSLWSKLGGKIINDDSESEHNQMIANNAEVSKKQKIDYWSQDIKEYKKICNVCGKIFTYTDDDLIRNKNNAKISAVSAVGEIASALSGNLLTMAATSAVANSNVPKIIDYSKCPNCGSKNIKDYIQSNNIEIQKNDPYEEIKRAKELFDLGILTKDEFEKKKKDLLGL